MVSNRIQHTVHIDADPSVVYQALVTPELVTRWLCHEARIEAQPGGAYELNWTGTDQGAQVRYHGSTRVEEAQPGERLVLKVAPEDAPGPDGRIEFQLARDGSATDLTLIQTGLGEDLRVQTGFERGWLACLAALRSLLEDPPGKRLFAPAMHRDLPIPGHDPCGIAWDGSALWLSDAGQARLTRLDERTGRPLDHFPFEGEPAGLAFDGEHLWQAEREDRLVLKLTLDGKILKRLDASHVKGELTGVAWDGQYLWLGDGSEFEGRLLKVQPRSGIIHQTLPCIPGVSGLAWDGSMLWVADYESRTLYRIEPRSGDTTARVAVKGHPTGLAWDGERLWYADAEWKLLSRILEPLG